MDQHHVCTWFLNVIIQGVTGFYNHRFILVNVQTVILGMLCSYKLWFVGYFACTVPILIFLHFSINKNVQYSYDSGIMLYFVYYFYII